jgi:hypothetical protein
MLNQKQINTMLKAQGLSQRETAKKMGINKDIVTKYFNPNVTKNNNTKKPEPSRETTGNQRNNHSNTPRRQNDKKRTKKSQSPTRQSISHQSISLPRNRGRGKGTVFRRL